MTAHIDLKRYLRENMLNQWERDQLMAAVKYVSTYGLRAGHELTRPVTRRSREIVYEMYGIPTDEQLRIEKLLHQKKDLSPIDLGAVEYMPSEWEHFYFNYVRESQGDYLVAFSPELVHNNLPAKITIESNDYVVGSDFRDRLYVGGGEC